VVLDTVDIDLQHVEAVFGRDDDGRLLNDAL